MKITVNESHVLLLNLNKFMQRDDIPFPAARKLYKNVKKLMEEVDFSRKQEKAIIDKYGAIPFNESSNQYHVEGDSEKNKAFINEMVEFNNTEIDVDLQTVSLEELRFTDETRIRPIDLIGLDKVITGLDDDEEPEIKIEPMIMEG